MKVEISTEDSAEELAPRKGQPGSERRERFLIAFAATGQGAKVADVLRAFGDDTLRLEHAARWVREARRRQEINLQKRTWTRKITPDQRARAKAKRAAILRDGPQKHRRSEVEKRLWLEKVKADEALPASERLGWAKLAAGMGIPYSTAHSWQRKWTVYDGRIVRKENIPGMQASSRRLNRDQAVKIRPDALALLQEGHSAQWTAEALVMSPDTVRRWAVEWRKAGILGAVGNASMVKGRAVDDPKPYDQLDEESRAILDRFERFRPEILGRASPPWATMTATQLTDLYFAPGEQYAVVNFNPGLGKSTVITHDWVLWVETLARAKALELTATLGHRSEDKAKLYLHRLRRTMETNSELIRRYGRFKPDRPGTRWSAEALDVEPLSWSALTEKEATFTAVSYEKSLLSVRARLIVWDDLIDRSNSATADQRERMIDWWEQEAETRLEPDGLLVLSNARFGPEDLSWYVRQQTDEEDVDELGVPRPMYRHIALPAHDESRCERRTDNLSGKVTLTHGGPWPDGCLLDPVRTSWRRLRKAKDNSRRFALVWQQEDVDPVGFLAQRAWFEGGRDSKGAISPGCLEPEIRFGQLYRDEAPALSMVTVDPSGAKWWSVQHIVGWPDRIAQVYRGARRIMQAPDLLYRQADGEYTGILHEWYETAREEGFPFTYLVVEQQAQQRWLTQYEFVRTWCAERGISNIPHSTTKQTKPDPDRGVEMLRPVYEFGRMRLPYGGHEERAFADQLIKEACAWPEGSTWDLVMGQWFYAFRADPLLVMYLAEESATEYDDAPSWISESLGAKPPEWARERLVGLTRA